ncbi:MAG: TonB-dependent receptor [Ignavibacteriae bacterium HGW-Ignavibacteriae-3]|nr:MAG: TonB-dependent receptor [Ignavibacteriae bacterium HGW-Ignavibacteriae-3]
MNSTFKNVLIPVFLILLICSIKTFSQGVTTASMNGIVKDVNGEVLPSANILAEHVPSGTKYGAFTTADGRFSLPNLKIGGPYSVTVTYVGYKKETQENVYLNLGQNFRVEFALQPEAVSMKEITVAAEKDNTLNSSRTGAATFISSSQVAELPSIKRSSRDIIRLDPRSDGNYSFGGKNWLYNNISLDGSYFNNSFGLDDPAPGGQTNAEPVPFDAIAEVQVSVAPFDVREGGFTGAGINTVTKSGTNQYKASLYSFMRNENFVGNSVSGNKVVANPSLSYNQSGFTASGPIIENKLFIFMNGEVERREDPGSNFAANRGSAGFGISRVQSSVMDQIKQRMISVYGYDPGPYENYTNHTDNEKFLVKFDWNINEYNAFTFRYNYLNARRDLPPHPFAISFNGTGRGPNENTLPFQSAGYRINNQLNSFAAELNSRGNQWANRFFASYNRFRDFREANTSKIYPTVEIAENGITYTTLGQEPFSIHNILDQDVLQLTNNFSYFAGNHVITAGVNFEYFKFYNSFNLFYAGLFMVPAQFGGTTFTSLADFFVLTDRTKPGFVDFNKIAADAVKNPFKGEDIKVGQLAFYIQDEHISSENLTVTYGLRVDIPMYFNDMVDNPFSRSLKLLDADGKPEIVDQSKLPSAKPLYSPRIGFNWDVTGDRSTQVRGGTGVFTGRLPFVWIGNNISNPGWNPNLPPHQQTFFLNAMAPDFQWPQAWTTNLAVDHMLPWDVLGTLEFIYSQDINGIYVRDANLSRPTRTLPDGRPYYGSGPLNTSIGGAYVIDNATEGYNYSITAQLRKNFDFGLNTSLAYTFLDARNLMKSTEIALDLFGNTPTSGNPNKPLLGYSEFGNRHRIIANATYRHVWSENWATSIGVFIEVAEGNRFAGAGGNRYSYIYSGDLNGDGSGSNDLIYIPRNQNDINFDGTAAEVSAQWNALNAFIEQDNYLKSHRGQIAERFGGINPWFSNMDLRLLQDFSFLMGNKKQTIQLSVDILNVANLLNSNWGVRQVANSAATSPLQFVKFNSQGAPVFKFNTSLKQTFQDDPSVFSRWQLQVGIRYLFN